MSTGEVTRILRECAAGEGRGLDELVPLVYDDLRRIAHERLRREAPGHTLDTTELVHEAYVNLVDRKQVEWRDRAHFFAVASRVIRHVLVDYARRRLAAKRGGGAVRVPLRESMAADEPGWVDLIALDAALDGLEERDERLAAVVLHRFFGGMTVEETAEVLGVSSRTVERDWTRAKGYLRRELRPGGVHEREENATPGGEG